MLNRICGYCENCHISGRDNKCENRTDLMVHKFGTFQQYITIAEGDAVRLPQNVDLKIAAPLVCAVSLIILELYLHFWSFAFVHLILANKFCLEHSKDLIYF